MHFSESVSRGYYFIRLRGREGAARRPHTLKVEFSLCVKFKGITTRAREIKKILCEKNKREKEGKETFFS